MKVKCFRGLTHDFEIIVNLMDNDLREQLHAVGIDDNQEFLDNYTSYHRQRFGEDFPPLYY